MFMSEGVTYMIVKHGDFIFKKVAGEAGTVNIFHDLYEDEAPKEVDVFTNYNIKADFDKFATQTREWYEENILAEWGEE